ncbi:MAG: alpha/beta fold hydrolase [Candidatus Azotimanducaceae bacterium WSBS_2022_MAG_OTU7]
MTSIIANGIQLEYEESGSADNPAIILVRGLGTQLIDWPGAFLAALEAAGFRVIVFDNRDVGLSHKFSGLPDIGKIAKKTETAPYTIYDMADDIVGLMDGLGIDRAHLFAISMGGMIGQVLAATHASRLHSLFSVMSSSSRKGLPAATPEAAATLSAETDPNAGDEGIIKATSEGLRVCGSPGYPLTKMQRDQIARNRHQRDYTPDGVVRQMAAIVAGGNRISLLESIKVPTLVIHGADDPLLPLAAGKDTAETIPGARLAVIPGMGHDLPEALVPRMIELILQFTGSLEQRV